MLTPDMIWEDICHGDELEAKGDYYGAYHKFCYAETAFDREEEPIDLIGDDKTFYKVTKAARLRRTRVWEKLTEFQKSEVANLLDDYRGFIKL